MLEKCLEHLAEQTRAPDHVLVVDNGSTDATPDVLARHGQVEALRLEENVGGPGGYARGLKAALERGFEWVWMLDDDAFAEPGCLAALVEAVERAPRRPDLLTSVVRWRDGRIHPMNRPWLRVRREAEAAQAAAAGLAPVRAATSVSTMVSRETLERHGFPPEHYEIWIDDIEWTAKILREGAGYLVPDAITLHNTAEPRDTITDARGRFYYKVRNGLWLLRAGESFRGFERASYALSIVQAIQRYVAQSADRREAVATVARGLRDGLRREPR
jgi:GT2 family glycosyltransferase